MYALGKVIDAKFAYSPSPQIPQEDLPTQSRRTPHNPNFSRKFAYVRPSKVCNTLFEK